MKKAPASFYVIANRLALTLAFVIAPIFFTMPAVAQTTHPLTFLDKGACPFECCTYQRWTVVKDTVAYDKPKKGARRIGLFKKDSRVRGLTGEVRTTQPGRFVVTKPHDKYKPGNIIWVYTSQGEGLYKVWFAGRMLEENMYPMGWTIPHQGPTCAETPDCWGNLETELKDEWWVKVRSPAGWIGWTDQTENFHGMDSCGG